MTDKIFGIHADTLRLRAERTQILAANLANAETPGYKAKDININNAFADILNNASALKKTNTEHLAGNFSATSHLRTQYRIPAQSSLDGNTVDMDIERSAFMQNMMMYQASLRFVNGRISGLLTAIRGE